MTCSTQRTAAATAPRYAPDYSGLRLRMRSEILDHQGVTDWRELPDRIRSEHVIAYVDATGFDVVWPDAIENLSVRQAQRCGEWWAVYLRDRRSDLSPHGASLMRSLSVRVEEHCSDVLQRMWDEARQGL